MTSPEGAPGVCVFGTPSKRKHTYEETVRLAFALDHTVPSAVVKRIHEGRALILGVDRGLVKTKDIISNEWLVRGVLCHFQSTLPSVFLLADALYAWNNMLSDSRTALRFVVRFLTMASDHKTHDPFFELLNLVAPRRCFWI